MNLSPNDMDEMSLWQLVACIEGVSKSRQKSTKSIDDIDDERLRSLGIEGF